MKKLKSTLQIMAWLFLAATSQATSGIPFWNETFMGNFPTGWSTGDASGNGVNWEHCSQPHLCPPAIYDYLSCRDDEFKSNGMEDGYLFVNSYKKANIPTPHIAYLRSSSIDCSEKTSVFLRFSTYIHAVNSNPDTAALVRVKSGNGAFTQFTVFPKRNVHIAESLQSWNSQSVLLDISNVAAMHEDVIIEWRWTGKGEVAWMIDNVELFDENPLHENAVWGTQTGQGDFINGQSGWSVSTTVGQCAWAWGKKGVVDYPDADTLAEAIACWNGAFNGAMTINSTFCYDPTVSPAEYSLSSLRSPSINLSNIPAGTKLALRFNQTAAIGDARTDVPNVTAIAVSINNGTSFLDTIDANPTLPFRRTVCGENTVLLPDAVAGASQVRLVFIFAGSSFFWSVDDIRIVRQFDHDARINPAYFSVAPDFWIPRSQVQPLRLSAEVQNIGNENLQDVTLFNRIVTSENITIHQDTLYIGEIEKGSSVINSFFPKTFTPPAQAGEYTCYYTVDSDEPDEFEANNMVKWRFGVSDSSFSKTMNLCSVNGYFTPNDEFKYELGNCYFVPMGSQLRASSVSFAFQNPVDLANFNGSLNVGLYKWKTDTTYADQNLDSIANVSEYEQVALNEYQITGEENGKIVTVPISFEDDPTVPLEDSTFYFVTISYSVPVGPVGAPHRFFMAASEEINYTATFIQSYDTGLPRFVSMLRKGDEQDFRANPWALRRIPFVQLNVQMASPVKETRALLPVNVFPNPATDQLTVEADFSTGHSPVTLEIFDICGRLTWRQQFQNGFVSQLPITVGQLANGTYTLRVITANQVGSAKFLIVR